MSRVALRRRGIAAKSLSSGTLTAAQEFTRREALTIGSYQPDDSTAGLLTGTAGFTTLTGDQVITTAGAVIQDSIINGSVRIRAANVTIKNCWIRGDTTPDTAGIVDCNNVAALSNAVITDCLIDPQLPHFSWDGIKGWRYTLKRCIVQHTTDGCGAYPPSGAGTNVPINVSILGSWIRNLSKWYPGDGNTGGTHNDGTQLQGGTGTDNIIIRGSRFDGMIDPDTGDTGGLNYTTAGVPQSPDNTQINACLQLNQNVGNLSGLRVEDNWFYGGSLGINGLGITAAVNLGIFYRNKFDRTRYQSAPVARIAPNCTIDWPSTGANISTFMDNGATANPTRS